MLLLSKRAGDLEASLRVCAPLVAAVLCRVQASILINDLADAGPDGVVGKTRWISLLPRPIAWSIVGAFLALGVAAAVLGSGSPRTILAYALSVLLAVSYSVEPLRFKERGLWGPLVYALSATTIYVVVPWAWLAAGRWPLVVLAAAVGADKWVQLHFHQVVDRPADVESGTPTYAVRVGPGRARSTLRHASVLASLCMLGATAYAVSLAGNFVSQAAILLSVAGSMIGAKVYTVWALRCRAKDPSDLVRELPWAYLGLTYSVFFVLPPVLFTIRAWSASAIWALVILSAAFLVGVSVQSFRYRYR